MWRKQNNPYLKDSSYLKIRGVRSRSCFIGVIMLMVITTGLIWMSHQLSVESKIPDQLPMQDLENPIINDNLWPSSEEDFTLTPHKDLSMGKYEFRGAWLASIHNLDYPKMQTMSTDKLKDSFLKILDVYQLYNLNAVIMQVRPEGDALYFSQLNPPSKYVTGKLGSPLPFDLLKFAITETHKRGMEFHAWFNPFRVTSDPSAATTEEILSNLDPQNFARMNPQFVLRFQDMLFLNPGEPEVIDFVHQTIMEVVRNYDIDAVHLDDYFYPYPAQILSEDGQPLTLYFGDNEEDRPTFERENRGIQDIKAWRRDNTYLFIKNLSHDIHDHKSYVQLGISPFGIWGHNEETEGLGSHTPLTSQETYTHSVFTDTRKWIKEELVDYVIPQLYWTKDETAAPYEELARWWNDTVEGTNVNLYIGHGLYKLYESQEASWQEGTPISDQITFNKTLDQIKGSAFFRFNYLVPEQNLFSGKEQANLIENTTALKENYPHMAIIPKNNNLISGKITPPKEVSLKNDVLSFSDGNEYFEENTLTKTFLIYQFPKGQIDCENPAFLFKKIALNPSKNIYHVNSLDAEHYTYGVSSLNRLQEESAVILVNP